MPHVSRHVPEKKVSDRIFDLFMECVTAKWSSAERRAFFDSLLTPTERILFAKRLAIIYMLEKGYTFEDIQEILRVSPSTISRIWKSMEQGKFKEIVRHLRKKTEEENIMRILSFLIPPMHQTRKQYAERARYLNL